MTRHHQFQGRPRLLEHLRDGMRVEPVIDRQLQARRARLVDRRLDPLGAPVRHPSKPFCATYGSKLSASMPVMHSHLSTIKLNLSVVSKGDSSFVAHIEPNMAQMYDLAL